MIKYNRVKRLWPIGQYHQTFSAVWGMIPEELKKELTSRQLVMVCTTVHASFRRGKGELNG